MGNVPGIIIVKNTMARTPMNVPGGMVCSETLFPNGEPPHHP